jgi:eukaryotic-like serine/threonine-protein kinase
VIVDGFNDTIREALRDEPDKVFAAYIDPLRQRTPSAARLDAEAVCRVLEQLLKLVGKPDGYDTDGASSSLQQVLQDRYKKVATDAEAHIGAMAVAFLEQSQYRLAGAEEAVSQILDRLRRTVMGLEGVRNDLAREVQDQYLRLFPNIGSLTHSVLIGSISGRTATATMEVFDLLETYPQNRLKQLVLESTLSVYRGLITLVPEFAREIAMCRTRLLEMHSTLGEQTEPQRFVAGPGRMILPPGVEGLEGAVDVFLGALPHADILEFDAKLQIEIAKRFRSMVNVCVKQEYTQPFLKVLGEKSLAFLSERLEQEDPAAAFFRYRCDNPEHMKKMIGEAFEDASPDLTSTSGRPQTEMTILACPVGPDGDRFRLMMQQLMPNEMFLPAALPDDIVFQREYPLLPMTELPQLSSYAQDAYLAQLSTEISPHARVDISWNPLTDETVRRT